ncbi:MAG: hypothetical protein HKM94_06490 [Halobacteria archaeon]|nr:hypothetical protein [Halobacteria archaeon]
MSKIRGKDFAKTVIITPEESGAIKQQAAEEPKAAVNRRAAADRRAAVDRRGAGDRRAAVTFKGPRKGLGGWSVFFLVVIGVVWSFGIVAILMHLKVLPAG